MGEEIWLPIADYEGLYEVSNFGNIRNTTRNLHLNIVSNGYLHVGLCKNGKPKSCTVHRLVAKAFIPNPENKPVINHINSIKNDNNVSNLEWCTQKENIIHSIKKGLSTNAGKIQKEKKVINTQTGKIYNNIKQAAAENNFSVSLLYSKLNGKSFNDTGLILYEIGLSLKENIEHAKGISKARSIKSPYKVIDTHTGVIYKSIRHAARENKISHKSLTYKITKKEFNDTNLIFYELGLSTKEHLIKNGLSKPNNKRMPKGYRPPKKVKDTNTGSIYKSIYQAAFENKIIYSVLSRKLNGHTKNNTSFILYEK